ncbi:Insulin-like growth factor binding protein, N-terminal [Pseudocohnilembus persalinus]|uniref:Insulin-like growth factor binding protein, N-terminal n=1 Tax=Pseudocohnilembus persalinus TaxID=266149 RepID=A0A0V0R4Y8_PSEPJ|nr:Insulin-like growth factor binding protein, N-terminal [Pseudocohnilembus persalinus]|eukprot:KRX09527.1 Insulin-like growth factor binding protein, N-terminal [Pseudocohnilembus persalinus]
MELQKRNQKNETQIHKFNCFQFVEKKYEEWKENLENLKQENEKILFQKSELEKSLLCQRKENEELVKKQNKQQENLKNYQNEIQNLVRQEMSRLQQYKENKKYKQDCHNNCSVYMNVQGKSHTGGKSNPNGGFKIIINGQDLNFQYKRGWNFVVLNNDYITIYKSEIFDTHDHDYTQQIVQFLNQIPDGYFVAYGVSDSDQQKNGNYITDTVFTNLQNQLGYNVGGTTFRNGVACIGQKGGQSICEKKESESIYWAKVQKCISECKYNCLDCETTPSICNSCKSDPTRENNPPNCYCKKGHYDNGQDLACPTCSPDCHACYQSETNCCSHKCDNCQENTENCTSCSSETRGPVPDCHCKAGYYEENQTNNNINQTNNNKQQLLLLKDCLKCNQVCLTCVDRADNCLTCITGANRNPAPDCQCQKGFYEFNFLCLKCENQCAECTQDANNCLTCITGANRNPAPDCQCQKGFYEDLQGAECLECGSYCASCAGSSDNCLNCFDDLFRVQEPFCFCQSGYYQDGESLACLKCSAKCTACSDENVCTVCPSLVGRKVPDCECQPGYYELTGQVECGICQSQCKTCETIDYYCTSCTNPNFLPPLCQVEKDGNFNVQEDEIIVDLSCGKQCKQCLHSYNNCVICSKGKNRYDNPPLCSCKDGYYDNNGTLLDCYKCSNNCLTCYDHDKCLSCNKNYGLQLNEFTLKCDCKIGYKFNDIQQKCIQCFFYKGECLFQCPKSTFQDLENSACYDFKINILYTNLIYLSPLIYIFAAILIYYCTRKYLERNFNYEPVDNNMNTQNNQIGNTNAGQIN